MWERNSLFLIIKILSCGLFIAQAYAYDDDYDDSSQGYDDPGDDDGGQSYDDDGSDDSADDSVDDSANNGANNGTVNAKTSTANTTQMIALQNAAGVPQVYQVMPNAMMPGTTQSSVNVGNLLSMDPDHAQQQLTQMINSLSTVKDHLQNNPYPYSKKALAIGFAVLKQLIDMGILSATIGDIESFISGATLFKTSVINNATASTSGMTTTAGIANNNANVQSRNTANGSNPNNASIIKTVPSQQRNRVFVYQTKNKPKSCFVYKQQQQAPQVVWMNKYIEPNGMIATRIPMQQAWSPQILHQMLYALYNQYAAYYQHQMKQPDNAYNEAHQYTVYQGHPAYTVYNNSDMQQYYQAQHDDEEHEETRKMHSTSPKTEITINTPHAKKTSPHKKRTNITIQIAKNTAKSQQETKPTVAISHNSQKTKTVATPPSAAPRTFTAPSATTSAENNKAAEAENQQSAENQNTDDKQDNDTSDAADTDDDAEQ